MVLAQGYIGVYESVSWTDNTGVLCENVWLYESSRYDVKLPMWA